MVLPGKIASCFGALEYWSIGVLEEAKARVPTLVRVFITPLLHHSITPEDSRKREKALKPLQGGPT
jgi:hypothetical protein